MGFEELDKLRKRVAELEKALSWFYDDSEIYEARYEPLSCGCCTDIYEPINDDKGEIARDALEGKWKWK